MEGEFDDCLGPEILDNSVSRDFGLNLFEHLEVVEPDVHSSHRSAIEQASNEEHNTEMLMRLARAIDGSTPITRGTQETYCSFQPSGPVIHEHTANRVTSPSASTPVKSIADMSTSPLKFTPKLKTPTMLDCATSPLIKGLLNSSSPLYKSIDTPLNQRKEMITTEYTRRKLKTSENKAQLCLKTKEQPLVFQKVTAPRKSSSLTTSPVKRRRAKGAQQFRDQIAGTSENDIARQHATELKRIKGKAKKNLESSFGLSKQKFTPQEAQPMKEIMNITCHQFKLQSMFLKSIGAALQNEHAVSAVHKNITKGELKIQKHQQNMN